MSKLSQAFENLLRLAILAGFALLFYRVVTQGELLQLIHPQFTANAKIGLGLFVLLVIVQIIRLVDGMIMSGQSHRSHLFANWFYYLFVGALAIGFLIPAKSLGSISAEQKGLKHLSGPAASSTPDKMNPAVPPYNVRQPPIQPVAQTEPAPKQAEVITIDDTNHIRLITAMYEDTARFVGREVNLKGFVYRPDRVKPNQFMVVRFEISCCAADGMPSGLLVEWPDSSRFKNDSWVEVQGKIQQGNYQGIAVPLLAAIKISGISPLPSPYVYTDNRIFNPDHLQDIPPSPPTQP